jgi:hypothetical protein
MIVTALRINTQMYFLDQQENIPALTQRILASAGGTAGFVTFTPVGRGPVSVLVTPHTSVQFEEQHHGEDLDTSEQGEMFPDINFDTDLASWG